MEGAGIMGTWCRQRLPGAQRGVLLVEGRLEGRLVTQRRGNGERRPEAPQQGSQHLRGSGSIAR